MYLFCISCKKIVATIKVPTLVFTPYCVKLSDICRILQVPYHYYCCPAVYDSSLTQIIQRSLELIRCILRIFPPQYIWSVALLHVYWTAEQKAAFCQLFSARCVRNLKKPKIQFIIHPEFIFRNKVLLHTLRLPFYNN